MEPYSAFFDEQHQDLPFDIPRSDETTPACDSRYRQIIGQLDAMIDLVTRQAGRSLGTGLDRFFETIRDHISAENAYMDMVNFPLAMQHQLHHQFICAVTTELRNRLSQGREVLSDELDCIRQLWVEHIHSHDQVFEEYLAA